MALSQPWLTATTAAVVFNWISPPLTNADSGKIRRWARDGRLEELGIRVRRAGGQYWVSTDDLLAYGRARIEEINEALDEIAELRAEAEGL